MKKTNIMFKTEKGCMFIKYHCFSDKGYNVGCFDHLSVRGAEYVSTLETSAVVESAHLRISIIRNRSAVFITVYRRDDSLIFDSKSYADNGVMLYQRQYDRCAQDNFTVKLECKRDTVTFSVE